MKRDNDLIRELLFEAEAESLPELWAMLDKDSDLAEQKRNYHAKLLCDAGFLDSENGGIFRMTNQGHDYLDAIRDEGIWAQTKSYVAETGGSATLEIFKSLAVGLVKKKLEKHTGIEL